MRIKPAIVLAVIALLSLAPEARGTGWYSWVKTPTRTPTGTPTLPPTPTPTQTPLPPLDAFQVRYSSNLAIGDSVVNLTNTGTQGGAHPAGNICSNVYVFDPDEHMVACCSCLLTPNGLRSLSANLDLTIDTLTGAVPTSIIIKLLASIPTGGSCDAATPTAANLAPGMRAWATTLHALPGSPATYAVTETQFTPAVLSTSELTELTTDCATIEMDGGGAGICKACRTGGL